MRETNRARAAFADLLALGEGASLTDLQAHYWKLVEAQPSYHPPSLHLGQLKRWSSELGWQQRLEDRSRQAEERAAAEMEKRRKEAIETGAALDFERVLVLKGLLVDLLDDLTTQTPGRNRRWLTDIKMVGSGEDAKPIEIERFNEAEYKQLRGILDDLAKETGGRKQILEHAGPGGKPIQIQAVDYRDAVTPLLTESDE